MPFAFILFFSYALAPYLNKTSFLEPFDIAVIDYEQNQQTDILLSQLKDISVFNNILEVGEDEAEYLISQNIIAAAIIIPEGFAESVMVGENKPVMVIGNRSMPLQSRTVKNLVQSAASLVTAGQSAINTVYHYSRQAGLSGVELDEVYRQSTMKFLLEALSRNEIFSELETQTAYDLTPMEHFTAALIVVFLMFAGMPGMKMMVTERSLGLTRRLAASSIKMWQLVLSKLIVSLLISGFQFSIVAVLTSVILKNYWGISAGNILLMLGAVVFAVSSWSVFVSAVSKTPAAADAIGNLGILLMAVIGGSIYPLHYMPDIVKALSGLTINKWGMEGFMKLFSGNQALSIAENVTALLIIGAVFFTLSIGVLKLRRR
jgi:ABC-2 type transport system permease protein